jgi:DNA-damage-inducible protein J
MGHVFQDVIKTRVERSVKEEAKIVLESMGMNLSDAIRLFLRQTIIMQRLPFSVNAPNAITLAAIKKAEAGAAGTKISLSEFSKLLAD